MACSVKMAEYWHRSFSFLFFSFLWTSTPSRYLNTHNEPGQSPAILTSHLINNYPVWARSLLTKYFICLFHIRLFLNNFNALFLKLEISFPYVPLKITMPYPPSPLPPRKMKQPKRLCNVFKQETLINKNLV